MKHRAGEMWELLPFYQDKWNAERCGFLTIRQVGSTGVWMCLCLETGELRAIVLASTIYQRVV